MKIMWLVLTYVWFTRAEFQCVASYSLVLP